MTSKESSFRRAMSIALAEAIQHLYEHPEIVERMSVAARERVVKNFTWDHFRTRLLIAYERAMEMKQSGVIRREHSPHSAQAHRRSRSDDAGDRRGAGEISASQYLVSRFITARANCCRRFRGIDRTFVVRGKLSDVATWFHTARRKLRLLPRFYAQRSLRLPHSPVSRAQKRITADYPRARGATAAKQLTTFCRICNVGLMHTVDYHLGLLRAARHSTSRPANCSSKFPRRALQHATEASRRRHK